MFQAIYDQRNTARVAPLFWEASILVIMSVALLIGSSAYASALKQFETHAEVDTNSPDHSPFASFLSTYVVESEDGVNRVRYGAVSSEDAAILARYVDTLSGTDPTTLTREDAFAYWVNFYNALTVKVILENYPVASIRDIRTGLRAGPWRRKLVSVNAIELSLDDIEHNTLREVWSEPRVHYAVNCASIGCPNLGMVAYEAENTEALLQAAAKAYVNHPRGVTIMSDGRVKLSSIYKWFKKDFGSSEEAVIGHLLKYAEPDLAAALNKAKSASGKAIAGYDYDWSLNDAPADQRISSHQKGSTAAQRTEQEELVVQEEEAVIERVDNEVLN